MTPQTAHAGRGHADRSIMDAAPGVEVERKGIICMLPEISSHLLKPRPKTTSERHWSFDFPLSASQWNQPTEAVATSLRHYAQWYDTFVNAYEQAIKGTDRADDGRIEYARAEGRRTLNRLSDTVYVANTEQSERVRLMLEGYRDLVDFADLPGQGTLLVRLVEDIASRLDRSGLLHAATPCETRLTITARPVTRMAMAA